MPHLDWHYRGAEEWTGDWADGDTHNWTRRAQHALQYDPHRADRDDGYGRASRGTHALLNAQEPDAPVLVTHGSGYSG